MSAEIVNSKSNPKCFSMIRVVKLLWFISFLPFIVVLLVTYAQMGDFVVILMDEVGRPYLAPAKSIYFYSIVITCALINAVMILLANLTPFLPPSFFPLLPNKRTWFGSPQAKEIFNFNIEKWYQGLAGIINLFLTLVAAIVYYQNAEGYLQYMWVGEVLILALLAGWLVFFFVLFSKSPEEVSHSL